ncbi:hypothetical protein [Gemmatimonas sp.]
MSLHTVRPAGPSGVRYLAATSPSVTTGGVDAGTGAALGVLSVTLTIII